MGLYTPPDIEVDRDAIYQDIIDDLRAAFPQLDFSSPTLIERFARAVANRHAEQLELLTERAQGEFEAFGEKALRTPKILATKATGAITVTAIDTTGYTLPAGTQVSVDDGSGDRAILELPGDAVIAPGDSSVTGVTVAAAVEGADGDGLYLDPVLEQPLAWVASITVTSATSGGTDGETSDDYANRLPDVTGLLGTTLTLPAKFALAAATLAPVGSAMAIDLYKPGPPYDADPEDTDAPGNVTVAVRGLDGLALDSGDKTAVQTFFDANTVSFMTPWVIDPTPNDIDVVFVAVAETGFDPDDVNDAAEAAVLDFLGPRWGLVGSGDRPLWIDRPKVRFQDVSAVLNNVIGLDHWTTLTVNGGTADITMTGPAAVPSADSTASGTTT